jgi:hypothetical protein
VQPPVPAIVYVIVALPAARPDTTPVAASIVAIVLSELDQVPPVIDEVKFVDPKTHISCIPSNVPATGRETTVIVPVAFTLPQPPLSGIV